jgi:hypothetical protein
MHEQKVTVVIKKDTELYSRIEKVAAEKGISIERAVDVLVTIGLWRHLEESLLHLESM